MDILKILANKNRRKILRILLDKEKHISSIAKELKISVPVTLKHINILESSKLIKKSRLGNVTIISISDNAVEILKKIDNIIEPSHKIIASKNEKLIDVLKKMPGFKLKKDLKTNQHYIYSIDKRFGYYIFQVDGKIVNKSIDQFRIKEGITIEFQRLMPVLGKKIDIEIE